jgi:hypothetical protein
LAQNVEIGMRFQSLPLNVFQRQLLVLKFENRKTIQAAKAFYFSLRGQILGCAPEADCGDVKFAQYIVVPANSEECRRNATCGYFLK